MYFGAMPEEAMSKSLRKFGPGMLGHTIALNAFLDAMAIETASDEY